MSYHSNSRYAFVQRLTMLGDNGLMDLRSQLVCIRNAASKYQQESIIKRAHKLGYRLFFYPKNRISGWKLAQCKHYTSEKWEDDMRDGVILNGSSRGTGMMR